MTKNTMKMSKLTYYSKNATESALAKIQELCNKVVTVPGDVLNYDEASDIIKYLSLCKEEIERVNSLYF